MYACIIWNTVWLWCITWCGCSSRHLMHHNQILHNDPYRRGEVFKGIDCQAQHRAISSCSWSLGQNCSIVVRGMHSAQCRLHVTLDVVDISWQLCNICLDDSATDASDDSAYDNLSPVDRSAIVHWMCCIWCFISLTSCSRWSFSCSYEFSYYALHNLELWQYFLHSLSSVISHCFCDLTDGLQLERDFHVLVESNAVVRICDVCDWYESDTSQMCTVTA